ncbi:MAG: response regulator, partial [Lachnospiraceae bacterium]|nr:response regulator [Lachnospiraceae bacterium]
MQNILIVEDDMDIQELLQEFLQEAGYKADIADDGVDAVNMFAGNSYDLILLDIMLPKIDGFTVCEPVSDTQL